MKNFTLSQRMVVFMGAFVVIIAILAGQMFKQSVKDYKIANDMLANLRLMLNVSDVLTYLQRERGLSVSFLGGGATIDEVREARKNVDVSLKKVYDFLDCARIPKERKSGFRQAMEKLSALRNRVDNHGPAEEIFSDYTKMIKSALNLDKSIAAAKTTKGVGKRMTTFVVLETSKEHLGQFRGMSSYLVASKKQFTHKQHRFLIKAWSAFWGGLSSPGLVLPSDLQGRIRELPSSPVWEKGIDYCSKILSGYYINLDSSEVFQVYTDMISNINEILTDFNSYLTSYILSIKTHAVHSFWFNFAVGVIFVGVVLLGAVLTLISTRRHNRRSIDALEAAIAEIDNASREISEVGGVLSDGTSRQAASIEETAAAIEELSSMAAQNSENCRQARVLVEQSAKSLDEAKLSMKQLVEAMDGITKASEETVKIVKTIDEIAFQTNLLALNAAVEAARAGEAGAGFAVVADEVRSLAMRSAEAAKNTSELIENTLKRIREGSSLVKDVNEEFAIVEDNAEKVKSFIEEISAASAEQADGITQINNAVSDIDRVVQSTAAQAEELAASSATLVSQVHTLANELGTLKKFYYGTDKTIMVASERSLPATSFQKEKVSPHYVPRPEPKAFKGERKALSTTTKPLRGDRGEKSLIKPLIPWTDKLSVGVDEIDEQHKRLCSMVNQLNEAMQLGKGKDVIDRILFNLKDYVGRHFTTEEAYMEAGNYPDLEKHKDIHKRLTAKVVEYMERYEQGEPGLTLELLNFLTDWLKKHILHTDKAYAPYIKNVKLDNVMF